eukprot:gene32302-39885_t
MTRSKHPQCRLALSAIALAVLTLANGASAQSTTGNMTRVEVTGSSIRKVASENALPLTTINAEELVALAGVVQRVAHHGLHHAHGLGACGRGRDAVHD